ncbi:MAG: hypothetical protein QM831_45925 [Kofleriaceae bacterium]
MKPSLGLILFALLAGCPARGDDELSTTADAAPASTTGLPSCGTSDPVTLDDLRVESCDIAGLDAASITELAVAADGSLYILYGSNVHHFIPSGTGCSFTRDNAMQPWLGMASVEATGDGRVYASTRLSNLSSVGWAGAASGQCSSPTAYRTPIGVASDGTIVFAPATGPGLVVVDTATCSETKLPIAADETPRVFGRIGTDVVWGGPVGIGVGRAALDGTIRYALTDHAFGGDGKATLEPLGSRIASWALGYLFSVDAETGAALPSIKYDQFTTAITRDAADSAVFDAAPDGKTAFVIARDAAPCVALYKITAN